jgi:hypothetical protein
VNSARAVAAAYSRLAEVDTVSIGSGPAVEWRNLGHLRMYRGYRIPFLSPHVGTVSPGLLGHVTRHRAEYDLVHMHLSRGAALLPAAWAAAHLRIAPLVVQTHGMLQPWSGVTRPVDSLVNAPSFSTQPPSSPSTRMSRRNSSSVTAACR